MTLGFWLLSGACQAGAWITAAGTFLAFASVSNYLGWTGVASCGCLGAIRASPWHAFSADMLALALLATGWPGFHAGSSKLRFHRLGVAVSAVTVLVALAGLVSWIYGSPAVALARLRGETVTVSPGYLDFGAGTPGQTLEAVAKVQNWTDQPVEVIGGTSDCTCATTSDLPLIIPAREGRPVTIRLKIPASTPRVFTRVAELWTADEKQRTIRLQVGCYVLE